MPRRKPNPLVTLAKAVPTDVDKIALEYDSATDKEQFIDDLGDLMKLRRDNISLYARLTLALGIHQKVEEETEQYLILYHSNQGGVDRSTDNNRVYAMMMYLVQTYVDVSFSLEC